ncbi:MAG TPA: discoidin domain-containing protein [Tepidisphaeraceae bacterium]|nr:discoidin domain-containing protein [Tepidisphaeraceae bacterium]
MSVSVFGQEGKNLCVNGGFERSMEAAASSMPQGWGPVLRGTSAKIELVNDAAEGKHSLRMVASGEDAAGMNGSAMPVTQGVVRFQYKAIRSAVAGKNLALFVIALDDATGAELGRTGFSPAAAEVGDGKWHAAELAFDFHTLTATNCILAPRVNENSVTGDGEWLLDDVRVVAVRTRGQLSVTQVWADKPAVNVGDHVRFSAFVENTGGADVPEATVSLTDEPVRKIGIVPAGGYQRVDWELTPAKAGTMPLVVTASAEGIKSAVKTYKILAVDHLDRLSRQELCTDEEGYWRLLDRPVTLQNGNAAALKGIQHKTSAEIGDNPYGICVHLPRSKEYEDPFNVAHLIDDDAETCWSSQQRPSSFPGNPPVVEMDLGRSQTISQVNLVPYWRNTDFPLGVSIWISADGATWQEAFEAHSIKFNKRTTEKRGDKKVQVLKLPHEFSGRFVRVSFDRLPLSGGNFAEVSQGYKARLSGIELIDAAGKNVALASDGVSIKASDTFTGWQDTVQTIDQAFPKIMEIGAKWVRVGQWGDQTEWAAVEREKGKFAMDPATDRAINTLAENHVGILYGLNYGNALYDANPKPADIGPIFKEGHPFSANWGPRTEAGRQAFVRYVDWVVRKYQGKITWWELWNEENGWFPGHEPDLYGKLLYAVAKHIKEINPDMKVMYGGTAAPAPVTAEIALRHGAAPYLDAYAFHPYGIDMPEGGMGTMEQYQGKNVAQSREQLGWNHLEDIVAGVRKPFAQHGKPNIGVWLDEWSLNVSGLDYTYKAGVGEYGLAKYLTRFYIYNGWLGQPTAWWALHTMNKSQDWGIIDPETFGFRPMSYAMQNVCSVVSDVASDPVPAFDYAGAAKDLKVIAYHGTREKKQMVLVWSAELHTENVEAYPGRFSVAVAAQPKEVVLTDLYWGVEQPAKWTYENGRIVLPDLIVRDYPVVITLR